MTAHKRLMQCPGCWASGYGSDDTECGICGERMTVIDLRAALAADDSPSEGLRQTWLEIGSAIASAASAPPSRTALDTELQARAALRAGAAHDEGLREATVFTCGSDERPHWHVFPGDGTTYWTEDEARSVLAPKDGPDIFDRLMTLWQDPWSEEAFGEAQMLLSRLRAASSPEPVPSEPKRNWHKQSGGHDTCIECGKPWPCPDAPEAEPVPSEPDAG